MAARLTDAGPWPERDDRKPPHQATSCDVATVVSPAEQLTQQRTKDREQHPVSPLVAGHNRDGLGLGQQPVRQPETPTADNNLSGILPWMLRYQSEAGPKSRDDHDHI